MIVLCSPARQTRRDPRRFLVSGARRLTPQGPQRLDHLLAAVRSHGHQVVQPQDHRTGSVAAVRRRAHAVA